MQESSRGFLKALAILSGLAAAGCVALTSLVLLGALRATVLHVFALPAGACLLAVTSFALALEIAERKDTSPEEAAGAAFQWAHSRITVRTFP